MYSPLTKLKVVSHQQKSDLQLAPKLTKRSRQVLPSLYIYGKKNESLHEYK